MSKSEPAPFNLEQKAREQEKMNTLAVDPKIIAPAWHSLEKAMSFKVGTIRNKTQYKQAVNLMNGVLDIGCTIVSQSRRLL